jgi:hypothetical protein
VVTDAIGPRDPTHITCRKKKQMNEGQEAKRNTIEDLVKGKLSRDVVFW